MFYNEKTVQDTVVPQTDTRELTELIKEYRKTKPRNIKKERDRAIQMLKYYCIKHWNAVPVTDLKEDFYDNLIIYYIPKYSLKLSEKDINAIINEVEKVFSYIKKTHGVNLLKSFKNSYNNNSDELKRVYYMFRNMQQYTESPILSWNPLIIDLNSYKLNKSKKSNTSKKEVYDHGYFEVIDKYGKNIILKKVNTSNNYFKIKLDNGIVGDMKYHDIINMRIKRRLFYTTWDIIDIKEYFSSKISDVFINV